MLVKTLVVLVASPAHCLRDAPHPPPETLRRYVAACLDAAAHVARNLNPSAVEPLATHAVATHLAHLLVALAALPEPATPPATPPAALVPLLSSLIALLACPATADDARYARYFYKQMVPALPVVDRVLRLFPALARSQLVPAIIAALAADDPLVDHHGFAWDVPMAVEHLDIKSATLALANLVDLGDALWHFEDRKALLSFVAVLSSLLQRLPNQVVVLTDDQAAADAAFEELADLHDEEEEHIAHVQTLRPVMKRITTSLKRIVSEDTVRKLLSAAVEEGRHAVVKVCQMFNCLTRRDKTLDMAFNNVIAFWPRPRGPTKSPHVLSSLWQLCLRAKEGSPIIDTDLSTHALPLRDEAGPVLRVFASSYSYLLFIQDEEELFHGNWPFSMDKVREIVLVLKHYLFAALDVRPTNGLAKTNTVGKLVQEEPQLLTEISHLLSRLYVHDSRRPFRTGDNFWVAGQGLLTSEAFISSAVEAWPDSKAKTSRSEFGYMGSERAASLQTLRKSPMSGAGELLRVTPYLVPFPSRAKIFQRWIAKGRDVANGGEQFFPGSRRSVSVRRKHIFQDAFEELNKISNLKATIRVKFIDEHGLEEAGIDGGGVFKEFMYEVLRWGFSPFSYGLFKATPDGHLFPNPDAPIANENFKVEFAFLGRLLGKAIFDGVLVDIPLARFFISKILGQFYYPSDLKSLDPELHKNMQFLKNCPPAVVEDLGLNFTVAINAYGSVKEVELVRNGKNISVTAENRIEYMHRVADFRMNKQIKEQTKAFLGGFSEIIAPQYIRLFSHEELQLLISGKTGKIDLDDLRRHTTYSGGYDENTTVIKWFWQAMAELDAEDQSKMLQFVTSSPRAPLLGFSYLDPGFCIHRAEGDVRLPTASTCMNLLKLPKYKSLEVVRQKLRYALHSNAGFDLS